MKTVVAWEDLLTLPTTRWERVQGRFTDVTNALTNDLTQIAGYAPSVGGQPALLRFRLERPRPVAVVAVMNWQALEDTILSYFTVTGTVRLRDGDLAVIASASISVPAQRQVLGLRQRRSAFALFASAPVAKYIEVEFDAPVGLGSGTTGRLFAASGMIFDDAAEESWSAVPTDDGVVLLGATGGVRPSAGARGRQISLNLSGLTFAQAYGSMAFGSSYAPALVDLQCFAGASRPVLVMVRADGAAEDIRDFSVFAPLVEPVSITRGEQADAPYSASLSLLEASA